MGVGKLKKKKFFYFFWGREGGGGGGGGGLRKIPLTIKVFYDGFSKCIIVHNIWEGGSARSLGFLAPTLYNASFLSLYMISLGQKNHYGSMG